MVSCNCTICHKPFKARRKDAKTCPKPSIPSGVAGDPDANLNSLSGINRSKHDKTAGFVALEKVSTLKTNCIEELRRAGYTHENARPLIVEWLYSKPVNKDSFRINKSGKLVVIEKSPRSSAIKTTIRDLMLMLKGTTRRNMHTFQNSAPPYGVELFEGALGHFDNRASAMKAFKRACDIKFSSRQRATDSDTDSDRKTGDDEVEAVCNPCETADEGEAVHNPCKTGNTFAFMELRREIHQAYLVEEHQKQVQCRPENLAHAAEQH
jgi:hypothetical protein